MLVNRYKIGVRSEKGLGWICLQETNRSRVKLEKEERDID
jgi:hypothetical protein